MHDSVWWLQVLLPVVILVGGFTFVSVIGWARERRKEREAFYRSEVLKKIAESPENSAQRVLEMLRQEDQNRQNRIREGLKLAGLVNVAVGAGLAVLLSVLFRQEHGAWLLGLIPMGVGAVIFVYVYFLAPRTS
ncbi:MAG TPA: hypothetical protein VE398_14075 [Acidobacteriota bacterium]|nr:hypothetical protein [Acidobacteriota bacterium]